MLTIDGNPLVAVDSGVLEQGAQGVMDFLDYNHDYDLKDRTILPSASQQRRQIDAVVNALTQELQRLQKTPMEAQYRNIGGTNIIELSVSCAMYSASSRDCTKMYMAGSSGLHERIVATLRQITLMHTFLQTIRI